MRSCCATFGTLLLLAIPLTAGDDGLTGRWKLSIYENGQPTPFWLLHLQSKDGKLTASADALKAPKATIESIKQAGDTFNIRFRIQLGDNQAQVVHFDYEGKLPKPGAKKILGSLAQGTITVPVVLEATTAKNAFEVDRETLLRTPTDPRALLAIMDVIKGADANKVDAKDLQALVDGSLKTGELYGPRYQFRHDMRILDALRVQKAYTAVAVATARKISKQIDAKAPADAQLQLLTSIADVLRAGKENDEAKAIETRMDKLEEQAYTVYSKEAPYKLEKFAGRKVKSDRAVLVELFTGAMCPPCVAADMAFDGAEKTYGREDVVLLQYHLHVPRPEPMSNPDTDARFEYYADAYKAKVRGTPTSVFNGKPGPPIGGSSDDALESYKEYCGAINKLLESTTPLKVSATATRKDDKIAITAKVAGLDKPGPKMRLRLALVEDWVRFKGSNGMQYHHRVVRALPGGVKGMELKAKDSMHAASVDLTALRKSLNEYLDDHYRDGPRPMRLRHLHVVAFVQDDATTEVLQAIDVAVKDE